MAERKRLYATTLLQAHGCSYQIKLKHAGFEPLPPSDAILAGKLFEDALRFYLPISDTSLDEAIKAANTDGLGDDVVDFVRKAIQNLPKELLEAKEVFFGLFFEREVGEFLLAGYVDVIADGNIYELKYSKTSITEPKNTHIFQVQQYLFLSDKTEGTLLYVCDTRKPSVVAFSIERWPEEKFLAVIRGLQHAYNHEAPVGLVHDWLCEYCNFSHVCEYKNTITKTEKTYTKLL